MKSCCSPKGSELGAAQPTKVSNPPDRLAHSPRASAGKYFQGELARIPAGSFAMGDHSGDGYPADGERPVHEVQLPGFSMTATTITNAQFKQFIDETRYITTAERSGISAVFYAAFQGRRSDISHQVKGTPWWLAVHGASWRHPHGPESEIDDKLDHPVVHVSWLDAVTYCEWVGGRLPTEAEWEYAARGGLSGTEYAWGNNLMTRDHWNCNIWQGEFPARNTGEDGYLTTAPGKTYRPNGYGLWQMAGNVWEWCQDWFSPRYYAQSASSDPRGPKIGERRVLRGGSYLCHASYCNRYRVAARNSNTSDSTSGNIGFRCVITS